MTNPDNAVGTNAAYGGRTSVNAFNDNLSAYSRGVMSGWACTPAGGLVVSLGGNGTERDVAVAEDNIGNKTSINNISGSPITLTMSAAPGAGTRIDSIVAYVDASPQGEATVTDNYGACGLIVVQGTPSSTPTAPSDNEIRSAITSDGASGPTAYYVVLANINMASGTTDITEGEITAGDVAKIASSNLDFGSLVNYIETPDLVTINNVGSYGYKIIPGTAITLNVKAGEEYLLFGSACVKPTNTNEVYLLVEANSNPVGSAVLNSNVAPGWTNLTKIVKYAATSTGSVTFSLFSGTGGVADTSIDVLRGASLTVIKTI